MATEVLIVIPTLGERVDYLRQTLESIRNQQVKVDIMVVTPASALAARALAHEFNAKVIDDPGSLPAAINLGVAEAGMQHRYVNWLGDDDLLTAGSLQVCVTALATQPKTVLAYGACEYIDEQGQPRIRKNNQSAGSARAARLHFKALPNIRPCGLMTT